MEVDVGVLFAVAAAHERQERAERALQEADANDRRHAVGVLGQALERALVVLHDALGVLLEQPARLGEAHRMAVAHEQERAQLLLEARYVP